MDPNAYDLHRETERYAFPDVISGSVRLNRGMARPQAADRDPEGFTDVRVRHRRWLVSSTVHDDGAVLEMDRPAAGVYVGSRRGAYLDLYLGVAQRLFDDARLSPRLRPLAEAGLLLRREINTDDYLGFAPPGVWLPQDLARLVAEEAQRSFPRAGGYRLFFSNSGTEAVEAALKASMRAAHRRFLRRHGVETWAAACRELGIAADPYFAIDDGRPVWADYPLFFVAIEGAFHGRTLGALSLTKSRPVQREGFATWRWARHVPRNDPGAIDALIDARPLPALLREPGALAATIAAGRIPADLFAGAIFEPMQGEGGYRLPDTTMLRRLRAACDRFGAQLIDDEVQTFARGGRTFLSEWHGVRPDIVCLAKAAVLGMTIIPADVADELEQGWHSNTYGSGKLFDVNYAYAAFDAFLNERDPLFLGLSFAENEGVKGDYLRGRLDELCRRWPEAVADPQGVGCMWGLTVADRPRFIREAWRQGAKVLGAGQPFAPGRIRIILPADVLTKEIDDVIGVLDRTCARMGEPS